MTLRIGLVGTGSMGRAHLRAWRAVGVDVVGVVASRPASTTAFAAEHDVPAFASVAALLEACDAVDLCVPTEHHAPLVLLATESGRDVVCEKPLALGVAEGRRMIEACERHGVLLLVAQVLRFFPTYRRAAEFVRAGELGALTHVALRRASSVPARSWFRDASRSGGLALDLLVHDADYACWLLGTPSAVRHEAMSVPNGRPDAERTCVRLAWPAGATGVLDGSWNLPGAESHFRLEGTRGVLRGRGATLTFAPVDRPTDALGVDVPAHDPFELQARHLAAALRREATFEVTTWQALRAVEVCVGAIGS